MRHSSQRRCAMDLRDLIIAALVVAVVIILIRVF